MNSRVEQILFPENQSGLPSDMPYLDTTVLAIDEEAHSIVDAAYQRTFDHIRERRTEVEQVAMQRFDLQCRARFFIGYDVSTEQAANMSRFATVLSGLSIKAMKEMQSMTTTPPTECLAQEDNADDSVDSESAAYT